MKKKELETGTFIVTANQWSNFELHRSLTAAYVEQKLLTWFPLYKISLCCKTRQEVQEALGWMFWMIDKEILRLLMQFGTVGRKTNTDCLMSTCHCMQTLAMQYVLQHLTLRKYDVRRVLYRSLVVLQFVLTCNCWLTSYRGMSMMSAMTAECMYCQDWGKDKKLTSDLIDTRAS